MAQTFNKYKTREREGGGMQIRIGDVFVLHLCRILWAADEMTLGRGGGLVSSQLVQGAGLDGWWLVRRVFCIYWTLEKHFSRN